MKYPHFLIFLGVLFLFSCKEDQKKGIETSKEEEAVVIEKLASSDLIAKRFTAISNSVGNIDLQYASLLDSIYSKREYKPIWTNRALREDLYRGIERAKEDGLEPEDYHLSYLKKSLANLSELDDEERSLTEIILTDAFFGLASDYNSGKLDPKKIYSIWGLESNKIELTGLLNYGIQQNNILAAIDSVTPKHEVYKGLKQSLKKYRELAKKEENPIFISEEGESIKADEKDERIPDIKRRLKELGYWEQEITDSLDTYDDSLQEAVKEFQEKYGIETDGVIGGGTIKTLNKTYQDRLEQILVNLERWRWYPKDLGEQYIIVNIANYRLHLVKNEDTLATHLTMVGTEARKTPVFSDKVEHIVYNPTWTIPPTIKSKDVIPSASKDPDYINRKNFSIFNRSGEKMNPHDVDWSSSKVKGYTFRQEAGPANPLGLVKIIYPNKYMIYLHDTPSKSLFNKNLRAQSSGCVRVQGVLDLAKMLLSDQPKYDDDKIAEILNSGNTTTIKVTQQVQVHHLYWTAWNENGSTRFAEDVYKRDAAIYKLLTKN
ncbi:Murein L,D-transpeptidase YcbB/YkuD [Salegentibacter holothuriorum]|uniref:Murein L,D-transpeptidase YcbB/YkuD n=1 Tax=Salegentibacter holothuriorum TaxID=241145 RepID=A0A1T5E7W1_9FLAO|nr:L,D-transpeptidase family protein [Salegentibacter holothuriorum]SKB79873.1 Murein L,D-transpeptidase YcbB/YkuD [Salegentibacter holothuriorum]